MQHALCSMENGILLPYIQHTCVHIMEGTSHFHSEEGCTKTQMSENKMYFLHADVGLTCNLKSDRVCTLV